MISFEVRRSIAGTGNWSTVASGIVENHFLDTGLTPGLAYAYQVRACKGPCSDWSTDDGPSEGAVATTPEATGDINITSLALPNFAGRRWGR